MSLKKMVFLEICLKQSSNYPEDYYSTYESLTSDEVAEFIIIKKQIHDIYNRMNTPEILNANKKFNSVYELLKDSNVSSLIIEAIDDFGFDFKMQISEETKKNIIRLFGEDYFNKNFNF